MNSARTSRLRLIIRAYSSKVFLSRILGVRSEDRLYGKQRVYALLNAYTRLTDRKRTLYPFTSARHALSQRNRDAKKLFVSIQIFHLLESDSFPHDYDVAPKARDQEIPRHARK